MNARPSQSPMRIVPQRQKTNGPRTGGHLQGIDKDVADCCYYRFTEVLKPIYTKIDARYPNRELDRVAGNNHRRLSNEARTLRNEARNQVVEAIIPMFGITERELGAEDTEADTLAFDLIVRNVFTVLVRSLQAWMDEFVSAEDVEITNKVVQNVADVQMDQLTKELKNFSFAFRPIIAPTAHWKNNT